jgi:hypothetical protein
MALARMIGAVEAVHSELPTDAVKVQHTLQRIQPTLCRGRAAALALVSPVRCRAALRCAALHCAALRCAALHCTAALRCAAGAPDCRPRVWSPDRSIACVQAVLAHALPTAALARRSALADSLACATGCCRLLRALARAAPARHAIAAGGGVALLLPMLGFGDDGDDVTEAAAAHLNHELVYAAMGVLELVCAEVLAAAAHCAFVPQMQAGIPA